MTKTAPTAINPTLDPLSRSSEADIPAPTGPQTVWKAIHHAQQGANT
jgi:hypothetical protein